MRRASEVCPDGGIPTPSPADDGEPIPSFLVAPREPVIAQLETELSNVVRSPFGKHRPPLMTGHELAARLDPSICDFGNDLVVIGAFASKVSALLEFAEQGERILNATQEDLANEQAKNQALMRENMLLRDALRMLGKAAHESAALTLLTTDHAADAPAAQESAESESTSVAADPLVAKPADKIGSQAA
jgi:hypothetical protein